MTEEPGSSTDREGGQVTPEEHEKKETLEAEVERLRAEVEWLRELRRQEQGYIHQEFVRRDDEVRRLRSLIKDLMKDSGELDFDVYSIMLKGDLWRKLKEESNK